MLDITPRPGSKSRPAPRSAFAPPAAIADILAELAQDNGALAASLRQVHGVCDEHGDVATASVLETWIDETEKRVWFLFESHQHQAG